MISTVITDKTQTVTTIFLFFEFMPDIPFIWKKLMLFQYDHVFFNYISSFLIKKDKNMYLLLLYLFNCAKILTNLQS